MSLAMEARERAVGDRFRDVRNHSTRICETLTAEDCVIQSMPDVSPMRWHLAHTTWFFETFVLKLLPGYSPINDSFEYLFNSYYNTVGKPFPRDKRGLLSRPTFDEVRDYRREVDKRLVDAMEGQLSDELLAVVQLGLHHEQQHQELMLTDIKHIFSCNPLYPVHVEAPALRQPLPTMSWISFEEGLHQIGHEGNGFAFDNESPRHRRFLESFQLANRLVTNGEFLKFVDEGGYREPMHWLSAGWGRAEATGWDSPLHWVRQDNSWYEFTLGGLEPLDLDAPVTHVSYFEADAFARWTGNRLPTEAEWEVATTQDGPQDGESSESLLETGHCVHPHHKSRCGDFHAMFGSVWQWTSSAYDAYPRFKPASGALGEYNGKFMCNQYVLRGSSCATSRGHARATYRNFFPADARWQFSGIRLARDV